MTAAAVGHIKGRASQQHPGTEALEAAWSVAAVLNDQQAKYTGEQAKARGEFVPWEAIVVRDDLTPRRMTNPGQVQQYAEVFDELPPILVQRDTFVLIDGWHRLHSAPEAGRDHVRIVEMDCPDDELFAAALVANKGHGLPLAQSERVAGAKRLLAEHPDWSDSRIADLAGVSSRSVWQYRADAVAREQEAASREQRAPQPEKVAPSERVGADGIARPTPSRPLQPVAKPSRSGPAPREQMAFDWLDALDHAFEGAPEPEEIEPEWATAAASQLRKIEQHLLDKADEASKLARKYEARASQTSTGSDDDSPFDDDDAEGFGVED